MKSMRLSWGYGFLLMAIFLSSHAGTISVLNNTNTSLQIKVSSTIGTRGGMASPKASATIALGTGCAQQIEFAGGSSVVRMNWVGTTMVCDNISITVDMNAAGQILITRAATPKGALNYNLSYLAGGTPAAGSKPAAPAQTPTSAPAPPPTSTAAPAAVPTTTTATSAFGSGRIVPQGAQPPTTAVPIQPTAPTATPTVPTVPRKGVDYQVYVENRTGAEITTTVNTNQGAVTMRTKANDKDWIHLGEKCFFSIDIASSAGRGTWKWANQTTGCTNLSISVQPASGGQPNVTRTTSDLEFKGASVPFRYDITGGSAPTPTSSTAAPTQPSAKAKYQVYIENKTNAEINTTVQTNSGPVSMKTKGNDKDWIHLDQKCISYITIQAVSGTVRWDWGNQQSGCTDLSISIGTDSNGKLAVTKTTTGLEFKGSPIPFKSTFTSITPTQAAATKVDYQVYVENKTSSEITVTVNTNAAPITKKVAANDKEWIHLAQKCVTSILIQNANGSGTWSLPAATCDHLSMQVTLNAAGQLNIAKATTDLEFKGAPLTPKFEYKALTVEQAALANTVEHQVYVENHSTMGVDVNVFTNLPHASGLYVRPNDKEWIHIQKACIKYIDLHTWSSSVRAEFAQANPGCIDLSLWVEVKGTGEINITKATTGLEFKGSPITLKTKALPLETIK